MHRRSEPANDTAPAAEPPKPNEPPQNTEPPKQPDAPKDEGKQHLGAALPPLNVAVTEETLQTTACVSGWTTTVRSSFFARQQRKLEAMKALGATDATAYELDHIIPLCLGGALDDPKTCNYSFGQRQRARTASRKSCAASCAPGKSVSQKRALRYLIGRRLITPMR